MKFYTGIGGNKLNMWWHFCCGLDHNPALREIYAHFTLSNSGGMSWWVAGTDPEALGLVHSSPEGLKQEHDPASAEVCALRVFHLTQFLSHIFLRNLGLLVFAKYYHEVIKVHLFSHQRVFYTITANKIVRFSDIYFSPGFILTILFLCSKIIIPILAAISVNQVCSNLKICTKECRALVVKG